MKWVCLLFSSCGAAARSPACSDAEQFRHVLRMVRKLQAGCHCVSEGDEAVGEEQGKVKYPHWNLCDILKITEFVHIMKLHLPESQSINAGRK